MPWAQTFALMTGSGAALYALSRQPLQLDSLHRADYFLYEGKLLTILHQDLPYDFYIHSPAPRGSWLVGQWQDDLHASAYCVRSSVVASPVQSFKCGPDYIDPKFHQLSSGRPSINLDLFMMSPEHVRAVYARHSQEADAVVLEGVMGLYDGYVRMHGSSAEVAKTVGIPTVLLVDARSSAYSVGASSMASALRQDTGGRRGSSF